MSERIAALMKYSLHEIDGMRADVRELMAYANVRKLESGGVLLTGVFQRDVEERLRTLLMAGVSANELSDALVARRREIAKECGI